MRAPFGARMPSAAQADCRNAYTEGHLSVRPTVAAAPRFLTACAAPRLVSIGVRTDMFTDASAAGNPAKQPSDRRRKQTRIGTAAVGPRIG